MKKDNSNNVGRIIQGIGGYYTVVDGKESHVCRARGNFRARKITPMVGDYVEYIPSSEESGGYITKIIDRKNHLLRPMVANIDMLIIVLSPLSPQPDFNLVDILLINAYKIEADVCLVVNKADLDRKYSKNIIEKYSYIEKRFIVSAKTGRGIRKFRKAIEGKTICFAGQSAVGKSSILNRLLPKADLETGEVSVKTQRGKHTTRQANLLEYRDGYVVDSPGFSMLELELEDPKNIKDCYPDFNEFAAGCKFNGCLHYSEPGCAVIEAVENGNIDKERHRRYKKIYEQMNERWKKDMIKISASILQADFANMGRVIRDLEKAGSDMIHLDVMDGSFVETITFGPKMVEDISKVTSLPLDVHLMIVNPEKHIAKFADAGADIITIHQEAAQNLKESLNQIKNRGIKCSVSIKPKTPVDTILDVLSIVDMVLVMTVEPGKGGQTLIEETLDKVAELKRIRQEKNYSYDIEVDGGIKVNTKDKAVAAGVDILVAGSAITGTDNYEKAISQLKGE